MNKPEPGIPSARPTLVVGVGASAGGLEAFKQLLAALPADTGMAFVLVQHLDPHHKSILSELLAPTTSMRVKEAEHGETLAANVVYVTPAGRVPGIRDARIALTELEVTHGARLSVDHLFRSLAREMGPRAAAVVLSGAGRDGSAGLRDIKAAGGLVIAQDPAGGAQTGMPQSAIDTGIVDVVLSIDAIPDALLRFERMPVADRPAREPDGGDAQGQHDAEGRFEVNDDTFAELASLLRTTSRLDLEIYKRGTVARRMYRRMVLGGHASAADYLQCLAGDENERSALAQDLLISVTDFFRDGDAFAALRQLAVDPLVAAAHPRDTLRMWVAGCATGEEAYSIAMLVLDAVEEARKPLSLQLFATDIDHDALVTARAGYYPTSVAQHIPERLRERYMMRVGEHGFQVQPGLRDVVSFAAHDLSKDPPFSRMDLVSCRNVLIYFGGAAQEQVLRALHFALKADGVLFLGSSESVGQRREAFRTLSKSLRLYAKQNASHASAPAARGRASTGGDPSARGDAPRRRSGAPRPPSERAAADVGELALRAVMNACVPPSLVVAEDGRVLYMHGELRPYLRFPDGEPRLDLASLVNPDLATRARGALYKCRRDGIRVEAVSSPEGADSQRTRIVAAPAEGVGSGAVVLSFMPADVPDATRIDPPSSDSVIENLEAELRATQEDLRNTVEELESANEELRSSNEEAMSMNEELQSANEELEATTEELRSLNEELTTVNAQLREKIDLVERARDDQTNFFASTKIATVFLDENLAIKRYTPAAEELLRLERGDEGRFVGDIARHLLQDGLADAARQVLSELTPRVQELRTDDGRWITRRILPYRTESRRIEGVVVTWVDVTDLRAATEQLAARERQQAVVARLGIRALEGVDVNGFLEQAVRDIRQTLDADFAKVLELQPDGERLLLRAGTGWAPGLVGQASVGAGLDSQAGYTLNARLPVFVEDLPNERRFSGPTLLSEHGVRSGLSCIVGGVDAPYGVIGVHRRDVRRFDQDDANFLQACTNIVSAALTRDLARSKMLLERAAIRATASAGTLAEAIEQIHIDASMELGASLTELWVPESGNGLVRIQFSSTPPLSAERIDNELGSAFQAYGSGVIGRVAEQRRAEWFSTFQRPEMFPEGRAAARLGLVSGYALPIASGEELLGVVRIYSAYRWHADAAFLRSLESLGRVLGDFVRRRDIEGRFRTTVEAAPCGIATRSPNDRFIDVNRRFCEMTGYSRGDLLARSLQQLAHPEDRDRLRSLFDELEAGVRSSFSVEQRLLRRDQQPLWVSLSAACVGATAGMPAHCIVIIDDISARKTAEAQLRASEARFRRVLTSSPAPMMLYDDDGRVTALSASWSEATGYTLDALPTLDGWLQAVFGIPADALQSERARWLPEPDGQLREIAVTTRRHERRSFLLSAASLGEADGGRRLCVAAAVDITDRRRAENDLHEASRRKDEFIAMLGHELRNPLAAVSSATQVIKYAARDGGPVGEMAQVLERQTAHIGRLLDGILDVSRITHGKIELEIDVVDLGAIVASTIRDTRHRVPDGLALCAHLPCQPLWIEGDAVRLTQVVDNLLSNAIRHTPPPGRIDVHLARNGEHAQLTIVDSGEGIEASLLPHLFETFQQGHQSLGREYGGLGLGLALVKALVGKHRGSVFAESAGPGRGATFTVRLPLSSQRASEGVSTPAGPGRGRRILVIEDSPDAAQTLASVLELMGHEVLLASRADTGIEQARAAHPEVVLCDLGLPEGASGLDVARALRADPRTRSMLLVALTGYGREEDRAMTRDAGFDAHLTKPTSFDDLERLLAGLD